jgi:hypothetical protein
MVKLPACADYLTRDKSPIRAKREVEVLKFYRPHLALGGYAVRCDDMLGESALALFYSNGHKRHTAT